MKKSLKFSLTLIVTLVMATMAFSISFADVESSHWAYDSIVRLSELEILSGIPKDGELYFEGTESLQRYQAAVLMDKFLSYIEDNFAKKGEIEPAEVEPAEFEIPESLTNKIEEFDVALKDTQGNYVQMTTILERFNSIEKQINEIRSTLESREEDVPPAGISEELRKLILNTSKEISVVTKKVDELETSTENKFMELTAKDEDIMESYSQLSQEVVNLSMDMDETKTGLNALSEDMSEILPKVSSNEESITNLANTLESYKTSIGETNDEIDTLKNDFASFKETAQSNYENIEDRVANVEKEFDSFINSSEMSDKLAELTETMVTKEELAAELEEMVTETDLNSILNLYAETESLDELKNTLNELDVTLSNRIQSLEDSVDKDLSALSRRLATAENNINELSAMEEDVNSLANLYSQIKTDVSSNQEDIDSLKVRLTSLESFEEDVNEDLKSLKNVVTDVANLQDRTDAIEKSVGANDTAIEDLSNRVDSMDDVLTNVASSVDTNTADIETLTATVSQNKADLENEITDAKKNMAAKEEIQSVRNAASTAAWIGGAGIILAIVAIVLPFFMF